MRKKRSDFYSKDKQTMRGGVVKINKQLKPGVIIRGTTRETKVADPFYSSSIWIKTRNRKRSNSPLCERCYPKGKLKPVRIVHHKKPRRYGGEELDQENLMSLCSETCHAAEHAEIEAKIKSGELNWKLLKL